MIRRGASFLLCLGLWACGENAAFEADILLDPTASTNPMANVVSLYQSGTSRGLYFTFQPLVTNPSSVNNVSNVPTVTYPIISQSVGLNPVQDTLTIDPSILTQGVMYKLSLEAFDVLGGSPTHVGVADCPVFIGSDQRIKICFGHAGGAITSCPGLRPFQCCEGINHLPCI